MIETGLFLFTCIFAENLNRFGEYVYIPGQNLNKLSEYAYILGKNLSRFAKYLYRFGENLNILGEYVYILAENLNKPGEYVYRLDENLSRLCYLFRLASSLHIANDYKSLQAYFYLHGLITVAFGCFVIKIMKSRNTKLS